MVCFVKRKGFGENLQFHNTFGNSKFYELLRVNDLEFLKLLHVLFKSPMHYVLMNNPRDFLT